MFELQITLNCKYVLESVPADQHWAQLGGIYIKNKQMDIVILNIYFTVLLLFAVDSRLKAVKHLL